MIDQSIMLWIIGAILTLTGLAGLLLPLVPGAPLLFLGLLLGAWAENFRFIGLWTLLLLAGMAALTYVVEFAALILGVKKVWWVATSHGGCCSGWDSRVVSWDTRNPARAVCRSGDRGTIATAQPG